MKSFREFIPKTSNKGDHSPKIPMKNNQPKSSKEVLDGSNSSQTSSSRMKASAVEFSPKPSSKQNVALLVCFNDRIILLKCRRRRLRLPRIQTQAGGQSLVIGKTASSRRRQTLARHLLLSQALLLRLLFRSAVASLLVCRVLRSLLRRLLLTPARIANTERERNPSLRHLDPRLQTRVLQSRAAYLQLRAAVLQPSKLQPRTNPLQSRKRRKRRLDGSSTSTPSRNERSRRTTRTISRWRRQSPLSPHTPRIRRAICLSARDWSTTSRANATTVRSAWTSSERITRSGRVPLASWSSTCTA